MTRTEDLKILMLRKQISGRELAHNLGITENSFSRKINNITEFKASEIRIVSKVLSLSESESNYIFLQSV